MYTFDTETSNNGVEAWVWSWALCDEQLRTVHGNGLNMLDALTSLPDRSEVWVHNLTYDGEFVFWELVRRGYKLIYDLYPKDRQHGVFDMLIDNSGIISMRIWTRGRWIMLRDSLRIFRCTLEKLPKLCGFALEETKGIMDYDAMRPRDHVASSGEIDYQLRDVRVLMRAMQWLRGQGAKGNTVGAIAVSEFKKSRDNVAPFAGLTVDQRKQLRSLYNGGVVHAPVTGRVLNVAGRTYDRNSMYPAEAIKPLPVELTGMYHGVSCAGDIRAYHVQAANVRLHADGFPLLITPFTGKARESIPLLDKWLFSAEYEAVRRFYDGDDWHILTTATFRAEKVCEGFVDKWYTIKSTQPERREYAKYVLNNLTGKFGENPIHEQIRRRIEDDESDYINYRFNEIDTSVNNWQFMPAVAYITAQSRLCLADAAIKSGIENLLYTDTDSVHTTGELPTSIIDDVALGAWKCENTFDTAIYIKPKSYAEQQQGITMKIKHAGVNNDATLACWDEQQKRFVDTGEKISFDNLRPGVAYFTRQSRKAPGGVIIERKVKQM